MWVLCALKPAVLKQIWTRKILLIAFIQISFWDDRLQWNMHAFPQTWKYFPFNSNKKYIKLEILCSQSIYHHWQRQKLKTSKSFTVLTWLPFQRRHLYISMQVTVHCYLLQSTVTVIQSCHWNGSFDKSLKAT